MELVVAPGLPAGRVAQPFRASGLIVARYAKMRNADRVVLIVTGFDLKTGKQLGEVEDINAKGAASVAAVSDTTALVSSGSVRLRAFDYEGGRGGDIIETTGPGEPGGPIVLSPDGKQFAFGVAKDNSAGEFGVRVYEWPSGKAIHTFTGHKAPVTAMTFSADGKTLASGSHDTTVMLWDLTTIKK